jgi:hypothetical protein
LALSPRQKALADAAAGALASLLALYATYPLDVYKTRLQASPSSRHGGSSGGTSGGSGGCPEPPRPPRREDADRVAPPPPRPPLLTMLCYSGWKVKTLHTCASSFCYFFLYGWLLRWHKRRIRSGSSPGRPGPPPVRAVSPSAHLVLSAAAAVLNTLLTLPLDGIASREQAASASREQAAAAPPPTTSFEGDGADGGGLPEPHQRRRGVEARNAGARSCHGEREGGAIDERRSATSSGPPPGSSRPAGSRNGTQALRSSSPPSRPARRLAGLWSGLLPSVLLCANPAIHYTAYDALKDRVLRRAAAAKDWSASARRSASGGPDGRSPRPELTMPQAFLLGVIAKLAATLATYPLIRAKVLLMVGQTPPSTTGRVGDSAGSSLASSSSLWRCLRDDYRLNGILRGWYAGCGVQLGHAVLKSALMMMAKERLTRTVRTLLRRALGSPGTAATAAPNGDTSRSPGG